MMKTYILTLFLLLHYSTNLLIAQAASNFDGVNDKATVQHHSDFNLGTHDFTIEAMVREIPLDKTMLTIISKRNLSSNGFALMINTRDRIELIAEIGKDVYKVDASALEDRGCHSVGLRRSNGEITFFIDGKAHPAGANNRDINTSHALIIGDDGANTHNPFQGHIEDLRFWKVAREDKEVFDWNNKCIDPSTNGLLANWSIEENVGQFFHDVAQGIHHAYLGSGFSSDSQDPRWASTECMETCCSAQAAFTASTLNPFAAQWVNFTNTSTNAISYEWSINNQTVSTNQHLQHSFSIGVFIVTLKVTHKGGCSSYYSEAIEVTNTNFSYCGNEHFTSPEIQAIEGFENDLLVPNPFPTLKMYDRFGNRYLPKHVTIPAPVKSAGSTPNSCSCGIFELYFEDMIHNRDYGFDDPILGTDRRAVACRVFEDLTELVDPAGTLATNLVKIQVKKSEGKAPLETAPIDTLDPGVLAVAGPYMITSYTTGVIDGLVYKTITSGTNALANTPGWNPNSYHGSLRVDFELPNFFLNNANWTGNTPSNQIDLYSTLLHESLHILGFYSLINTNTNLSKLNGSQLYNRFDTYLEDAAGTPYIDPATGILNPASIFIGSANCSADVKFNSTTNTNQDVYLPSPWNFSILSHFNCSATNNQGCANNNGYIMNACLAPGEMQRAPSQQEFNTLCDIGYQLNTSYGNSTIGAPANNVPYQTYASCSSPCPVSGIDDNLTTTVIVANGGTVTIDTSDFLPNDANPGGSYNLATLLTSFGTISNATTTGFDFTADPTFWGTAIIQYTPTCSNGNSGSNALIFITVSPPPFPTCDLPANSCNLLCFGDFENITGNATGQAVGIFDDFRSTYDSSGTPLYGSSFPTPLTTELIRFDTSTNISNWPNSLDHKVFQCIGATPSSPIHPIPFPVNYPNRTSYIGMNATASAYPIYDQIYLPLAAPLDVPTASIDNYRLTFWAFTSCEDVHLRMILSDAPPCINKVNNFYDPTNAPYSPTPICPSFYSWIASSPNCPTYTAALNEGIILNNAPSNPPGVYAWRQYSLDFHVNTPNVQHAIFHPVLGINPSAIGPVGCGSTYILLDEMTIEKIPAQPQLTVSSTIIGTACPGNKVIIEYDICSNAPVSGLDLDVQLPLVSGLSYTNSQDFINGQLTGLDLGISGSPLCTLLQVEIEIPLGANTPSTQSIPLVITGSGACTNPASNLTTDINIIEGSNLTVSVVPSTTAPLTIGNNFTVDIIVQNTGNNDIQNVVVDLPTGPYFTGLSHTFTATNIGTILAGGQSTINNVPIDVVGPCGDAQVCAQVVSANGACNLPASCSPLLNVVDTGTISFPIEIEGIATNDIDFPSDITIANNGDIYITGFFNQDINLISSSGTNSLAHNASCMSVFIAKYNSCGLEWAKEIPACALPSLYYSPKVVLSSTNEAYLAFSFENSFIHIINSTPTLYTSLGSADIGIMKFDVNGNALWFIQDGGVENDIVADVALFEDNPNNQIIISGIIINDAPFVSQGIIGLTGNSTTIAGEAFPYHRVGSADSWGSQSGTTFTASYTESPGASFAPKWAEFIDISSNPTTSNNSIPTQVHKLEVDFNGNIYVLGATYEDFPFLNKNTTNANGLPSLTTTDLDHFIISYDKLGTERWAGLYGSNQLDIMSGLGYDLENPNCPSSMKINNTGNAYIAIQMVNATNSCPITLPTTTTFNHFGLNLLKIDLSNGNLIWSKAIAESQCIYENHPRFNGLGDFIIGNHTFHPNVEINSFGDVYVSGNFLLEDLNNSNSSDEFTDIDFYSSNGGQSINYTNMGSYNQTINGTIAKKHLGSFVEKFSSNGSFEWVLTNTTIKPYTINTDAFIPSALAVDPNNNIYCSFGFGGQIDINSTTYNGSTGDGYIVRIQDQGTGGIYARPNHSNSNASQNHSLMPTLSNESVEAVNHNISTKLYPNPTTGKVTLEITSDLENNEVEQLTIYDVTGRKIQGLNIENNEPNTFELDLNQQQSGIYIIKMMINQELITKRITLMK